MQRLISMWLKPCKLLLRAMRTTWTGLSVPRGVAVVAGGALVAMPAAWRAVAEWTTMTSAPPLKRPGVSASAAAEVWSRH